MLNLILIIFVIAAIGVFTYLWINNKRKEPAPTVEQRYDLDQILIFVRKAFKELIISDPRSGNPSAEEYQRRRNRRKELRKALRSCMHGDTSAKSYVKSYLKDVLLKTYDFNETNINLVIPFDRPDRLSEQECFDILLYTYTKSHRKDAFNHLVKKHNLDSLQRDRNGLKVYKITREQIREVYNKERPKLSFDDKLNIVVQRVYQMYKGHGVIDALRDQNIDGVNGGTSGVPDSVIKSIDIEDYHNQMQQIPRAHDAVWVFYQGKAIQLEFLGFGSEKELIRVSRNIYSYGSSGELNAKRGYVVNDMADGSRILVVRPPLAESWAFFVRKHDHKLVELNEQIKGKNAQLAIKMLIFLVLGKQTTAITGPQGSGKTTILKGLMKYIQVKNIRVQEKIFELWARKLFPDKNILTLRETPTVSAQEGMDTMKKSDGAVNIVGEVASHDVASLAIQAGEVASEYTIVTHHARKFYKLVNALRNSLIANGDFTDEVAATEQVISWLNFNVHLVLTGSGERYIERISQNVPIDQHADYPESKPSDASSLEEKIEVLTDIVREYAVRKTDRKLYEQRDVIVWENGGYVVKDRFSEDKINEMILNMDAEDAEEFKRFLQENWGHVA